MSEDPLALYSIASTMPSSDPSVLPSESDYEAICAAVMETLRGRWFLAEYARRNRHTDTKVVLSAIERIEMMIRGDSVATPAERFRSELADMAKAIARTKSEIAAIKPEAEQPGKILEASEELDSIVHETETATSKILAAAEQVQEIAWTVREQDLAAPICDQLDALATDIYTACSFQDLTGQRIQKVIHAMRYLEERIDTMIEIWDEGVSAQNASAQNASTQNSSTSAKSEATPTAAKATAQPAHHDVAQDDLDQTDVDMVMDPAQQEAAVKAEPEAGPVVIDHEPMHVAAFVADPVPEAVAETIAEPQSFAPEGVVPETAESIVPESAALESHAIESDAIDSVAPQSLVPEAFAAEHPTAESLPPDDAMTDNIVASEAPDEVPVFFRAMEPGPVVEATPAEAMSAEAMAAEAMTLEAAPIDIDEAAPPIDEAIAPQVTAPQITAETEAAPVADLQPAIDLGSTIAAVREALFAPSALAVPNPGDSDAGDEPALVGDDEPAADLYEPVLQEPAPPTAAQTIAAVPELEIAEISEPVSAATETVSETVSETATAEDVAQPTAATLVGPAEFLLEPLPQPALRALEAVAPFADREPESAEIVIETVDLDTVGLAPVRIAAIHAELPEVDEDVTVSAEVAEETASEREAAVIEAVSPEPAVPADTPVAEIATAEIEIVEIDVVEAAPAVAAMASDATELEIVEIAEIEAVATAPVTPEPLTEAAEETAVEAEAVEQAKIEEPEAIDSEPEAIEAAPEAKEAFEEEAEDEERPAARTMMPEVTFASTAPVMMPMETTRTEPAEQRFAAAATATPTMATPATTKPAQDDFIPFGHTAAQPAPLPVAVADPSIYSTSPYLEGSRPTPVLGATISPSLSPAHVTPSDPLAAITALTDDEKIALFS